MSLSSPSRLWTSIGSSWRGGEPIVAEDQNDVSPSTLLLSLDAKSTLVHAVLIGEQEIAEYKTSPHSESLSLRDLIRFDDPFYWYKFALTSFYSLISGIFRIIRNGRADQLNVHPSWTFALGAFGFNSLGFWFRIWDLEPFATREVLSMRSCKVTESKRKLEFSK